MDDRIAFILMKLGHLAVERDRETWLRGLVELCSQAVDAERATIYLVDRERNELRARVAQKAFTDIRLPLGSGLAGHVATTGETINVLDAYDDVRFHREVDMRTGFRTRNALVVPVWGADGATIVGVIQVLNKRNGSFERHDQMLLERVAEHVGSALEQIQLAEVAEST